MRERFVGKVLFLNAGLLLWAAHFGFVYGLSGVVCARGLGAAWTAALPFVVAFTTVMAAGLCLVVLSMAMLGRGPGVGDAAAGPLRAFWRTVSGGAALFGFVAIVWTGIPALMIGACA